MSRDREPGTKAGSKVRSAVPFHSLRRVPLRVRAVARVCELTAGQHVAQLIRMAEEECVDKLGQTVHPRCLVIGCFGRKENDSQHLGHVPDVLLKNTHRESAARAHTQTERHAHRHTRD